MAVPFLISAMSLAYSVVTPDMIPALPWSNAIKPSGTPSPQQGSGSGHFFSGIVFGVGLSTLISHELRRRRILERARVAFFSWLYDNEEEKLVEKYRQPVKVLELEGEQIMQSTDDDNESTGFRCVLLSPDWAPTSKFNVVVLTLSPGTELLPKKTDCVEFYHVIKGDGTFSQGERQERIVSGVAFIVDPGSERGFKVRGRGELVLLRAKDESGGGEHDETRFQQSALSSTLSVVKAALNKVETMVTEYSEKPSATSSK